MSQTASVLGNLSPALFLRKHWQKQPLLIRNALPNYQSPIDPDELAGLACEEEVESRLIIEKQGPTPWLLRHGPFIESDFQKLPDTHWTLLVQGCNKYVPELAQLLNQFDFIPRWRVDDVMVSFAPQHGSVGPHVDQYDVFLLQAFGTRRWQISNQPVAKDNAIAGIDLHIMQDFSATDEWIVEPGDILYLPPGVAHFGLALEDCMTLSIGFRAPSYTDILINIINNTTQDLEQNESEPRFNDPDLTLQKHSGEISQVTLNKVRNILRETLDDTDYINTCFAQLVTQTSDSHTPPLADSDISAQALDIRLSKGDTLIRNEYSRFAFINGSNQICNLFIDGIEWKFDQVLLPAIALLCDNSRYETLQLQKHLQDAVFSELVVNLIKTHKLVFENDQ